MAPPSEAPHVPAISHFDITTSTRPDASATPRTPRTPRGTLILQGSKTVAKSVLMSPRSAARGVVSAMSDSADALLEVMGEKPVRKPSAQLSKKTLAKLEAESEANKERLFQELQDRRRQAAGMKNWKPGESSGSAAATIQQLDPPATPAVDASPESRNSGGSDSRRLSA